MTLIRFAEWAPDAADIGSSGAVTVTNALPSRDGYQPFKSLNIVSGALTARPKGGIEAYNNSGTSFQYVGDVGKLYELDDTNLTWTNVSKAATTYTTADTDYWDFARWENKIIATNFAEVPQQMTFGNANFTDLTTVFKARCVGIVGDFVVFGNTYDAGDGNVPNRVRWSAQGNETDYAVSSSTLSDYRDLVTGGAVRKVLGGEVGIIISERSIFRMSYIGAPVVFQIDEVLPDVGTISQGSCCRLGDSVYLISDHGFVELVGNGTGTNYIGAGKVDKYFFDDLDPDYYHRISCLSDPTSNRIAWAYPGSGNTDGRPNKIIIYDRTFGKWSIVEEDVEFLLRAKGIGVTLEELDTFFGYTNIDTMTVSLDSDLFKADASQFAAFDEDFKLGFFRGLNKTAVLTTSEVEIHPGYNAQLNAFRPLVDRGTVTARVGHRGRLSDEVAWTSSLTQSTSGRFTKRVNDRLHRFELTITGDNWTDALGVVVDPKDAPRGSGRA